MLTVGDTITKEMGKQKKVIKPEQIGFFHPCKTRSSIQYALSTGIRMMSFDSLNELEKISTEYYGSKYLQRSMCCIYIECINGCVLLKKRMHIFSAIFLFGEKQIL